MFIYRKVERELNPYHLKEIAPTLLLMKEPSDRIHTIMCVFDGMEYEDAKDIYETFESSDPEYLEEVFTGWHYQVFERVCVWLSLEVIEAEDESTFTSGKLIYLTEDEELDALSTHQKFLRLDSVITDEDRELLANAFQGES